MKLAIAVQRYGADINGGAELHARYIAERLARHADVEVVTTCAHDYVTWRNELPEGVERVHRGSSAGTRSTSSAANIRLPMNWRGWRARGRPARG